MGGVVSESEAADDPDRIGIGEAARMLEVGPDQVRAMVEEGLLTAAGPESAHWLSRAEVLAARNLGG
jgi:hypothetical protein